MAFKRLTIDGYGQIELNNVAFRRDGRIEAQAKPNATDFSVDKLENGMLLAVDGAKREVKYAVDGTLPVALNYSAEHMYDERADGLKDFYLNGTGDFLPRLGYLAVGDKFTTNCVGYDSAVDTAWATEAAFVSALGACASSTLYGGISPKGAILVSATEPTEGPKLRVIEKTTMPNGTLGVKFQVLAE